MSQYAEEGHTIIGDYRTWMTTSKHVREGVNNAPMGFGNLRFTADPSENVLIATKDIKRGDYVF